MCMYMGMCVYIFISNIHKFKESYIGFFKIELIVIDISFITMITNNTKTTVNSTINCLQIDMTIN